MKINHKVRRTDGLEYGLVKRPIGLPVSTIDFSHPVKSRSENFGVFKYGPVLYDNAWRFVCLLVDPKLVAEKK